ncbi:MAG TPA: SIS domain-containing protein [Thermoplasmata archaeon]|nr:SIS domain-containing protein [Thermoplasmata archaeon]
MTIEFPPPEDPSPPYGRSAHPFFLHDMILSQPAAIHATLRGMSDRVRGIPPPAAARPLVFTGMGTSFHAALAAAWAGDHLGWNAVPAWAADAFELLLSLRRLDRAAGAVVFSSSGETALTLEAQRALRAARVPQVLISGTAKSRSSDLADHLLPTQEAEEKAWVHTVSYTTAIAAALALQRAWSGQELPALEEVSRFVRGVVERDAEWRTTAEELRDRPKFLILGSGAAQATAREAALKLREGAGRFVAAVGVEEFLHGVLPSVDGQTAVLGVAVTDLDRRRAETALAAAGRAGAKTVLFARGARGSDAEFRPLPEVDPAVAPIVDIVPFQLLTYWLAVGAGRNPDVMGYDDPRILAARRMYGI